MPFQLEQSNLPDLYKGFVRTTCQSSAQNTGDFVSGICVGKLIPSIEQHYPNTTTKFVLLPHGLPELIFAEGLSSMDLRSMRFQTVPFNGLHSTR